MAAEVAEDPAFPAGMKIGISNLMASCNHKCLEKFLIFIVSSIKMRMTKRR